MRDVPQSITDAWNEGRFEGDQRNMARVTVQYTRNGLQNTARNLFAHAVFGSASPQREIVNIKKVEWSRSTDADAADCTIEIWNTEPLPIGGTITRDLDQPGYLTYNRGTTSFSSRWGHEQNEWSGGPRFTQGPGYLVPDNTIRTYEGYGFDDTVYPEDDPHLVQTGCWVIDEVEYTHDGVIILSCRDYGKFLLEHIIFPPVNPFRAGFTTEQQTHGAYAYPVNFSARPFEEESSGPQPTAAELNITFHSVSSQDPAFPGDNAIRTGGGQGWHSGDDTLWLSAGAASTDDFEWIQASVNDQNVRQVRFRTVRDQYEVYLSVFAGGAWQGVETVNGLQYVGKIDKVVSHDWHFFTLAGSGIDNVTLVRLTFTKLQPPPEEASPFQAGVRIMEAWGVPSAPGEANGNLLPITGYGNYDDYTDIVKLLCAWGGFHWPAGARIAKTTDVWQPESPDFIDYDWATEDDALTIQRGRIWGDLEQTGTYGVTDLGPPIFDKKPLMDGINHVREIVGFLFYVDELGSVVWRAPNIYHAGNLILTGADRAGTKTAEIVEIDEEHTLIGLRAKLSGRNLRERTFVSSSDGKYAAMVQGWNPNPGAGFRRVGGWSDQNFESQRECEVMAEMIALRQLFSYRTDTLTIPGYPKIQIDDQIRIFEMVTGEGFLHYVKSIGSTNDLETGEWTYEMEAHWLGEYPFERWAFDPAQMSFEARQYLEAIYNARI